MRFWWLLLLGVPSVSATTKSKPYLTVVGTVSLMFKAPEPEPILEVKPKVTSQANSAAIIEPLSADMAEGYMLEPEVVPNNNQVITEAPVTPKIQLQAPVNIPTKVKVVPAVIEDELRPRTRPESFLPVFQLP